jgi:hypothetical protein
MTREPVYTLLAWAVLVLCVVPIGTAVFLLGFVYGDSPCVMCWEQRTGMALVALIGLFILRYGPRPKYIGLAVLVGAWGLLMGLRHVGMHAARDIGQGFSLAILGVHTYTWAVFIYWVCSVTMGVLLMLLREDDLQAAPRQLRPVESLAGVVFLVVIAGNIVQAFASTGPPPFLGQGDPVRFSFNPKHWVWSFEEYRASPVSFRGRWGSEPPGNAVLDPRPEHGPLQRVPALSVTAVQAIAPPLRGTVTDLAYDPAGDRFLVTTQQGVYILDAALSKVLRYTVVDPGYSVDLGRLAGAAFLDASTVLAVGENKSYVVLKENDHADPDRNFRFFLESFDRFDELARSRFGTVRARMMYTLSAAFDPATDSVYTVTVPNAKVRRLVVSRFDRRDMTLSEEFSPVLSPASGLTLGANRSIDEYYVTGAVVADGMLYAASAAYSTILGIDLRSHAIVEAWSVTGGSSPTGLARKGDAFLVADGRTGRVTAAVRPGAGRANGQGGQ